MRPARTGEFDFQLLLRPAEREEEWHHEKCACFMLSHIFPVAVAEIVVRKETNPSSSVRQLISCGRRNPCVIMNSRIR